MAKTIGILLDVAKCFYQLIWLKLSVGKARPSGDGQDRAARLPSPARVVQIAAAARCQGAQWMSAQCAEMDQYEELAMSRVDGSVRRTLHQCAIMWRDGHGQF